MNEADRIRLTGDMALTKKYTITKDTELDLNGHTLSSDIDTQYLFFANGAKLTLKGGNLTTKKRIGNAENGGEIVITNGTYTSTSDVAFSATGEGSKVTMNGGKILAVEGGIGAFSKGEIEVNGGEITVSDNFCLFTNGSAGKGGNKITLNGGKLTGNIVSAGYEAVGVYIANNDIFIMNGGEILANNGTGLCMRAGDVTINNGKIVATGESGRDGKIGDDPTVMTGASAIIYHETANYPGKEGMKLTVNGGTIISVDHSIQVLSNEEHPQVFVNGGNLTPPYPEA